MNQMSREAFDLRNPACRANLRRRWRKGSRWFLVKLAVKDTARRVCSASPAARGSEDA